MRIYLTPFSGYEYIDIECGSQLPSCLPFGLIARENGFVSMSVCTKLKKRCALGDIIIVPSGQNVNIFSMQQVYTCTRKNLINVLQTVMAEAYHHPIHLPLMYPPESLRIRTLQYLWLSTHNAYLQPYGRRKLFSSYEIMAKDFNGNSQMVDVSQIQKYICFCDYLIIFLPQEEFFCAIPIYELYKQGVFSSMTKIGKGVIIINPKSNSSWVDHWKITQIDQSFPMTILENDLHT